VFGEFEFWDLLAIGWGKCGCTWGFFAGACWNGRAGFEAAAVAEDCVLVEALGLELL
jgi:hypothetical protein